MDLTALLPAALGAVLLLALLGRLLRAPLRLALRLTANTLLGFAALWAFNALSPWTGLSLGLNLLNAVILGVLGLPGFFLLLLTLWVL